MDRLQNPILAHLLRLNIDVVPVSIQTRAGDVLKPVSATPAMATHPSVYGFGDIGQINSCSSAAVCKECLDEAGT